MSLFALFGLLLTLSALFSYANYRWLRLPMTVGLMLMGLSVATGILLAQALGADWRQPVAALLDRVEFDQTLLHGLLSYLLFAGALHVDIDALAKQRSVIVPLATFGVVVSTLLIGVAIWALLGSLGHGIPLLYALLFGALISPTDPIAVLGILKTVGVPKSLETKIAGESLFNDGVGVVVFSVLLEAARGGDVSASGVVGLLAQEALGGAIYGFVLGYLAYRMLRSVDHHGVEVLITLALVTGGYALAMWLHVSGPIAVVVAGLLIGNHGRRFAMSDATRERLDTFWELVDEILNALLFVLLGLDLVLVQLTTGVMVAAVGAIFLSLAARFVVVAAPVSLLRLGRSFSPGAIRIMTWGGLRGGISVALALSLPAGPERDVILALTYAVVTFSVVVQGLTMKRVIEAASL